MLKKVLAKFACAGIFLYLCKLFAFHEKLTPIKVRTIFKDTIY